MYVSYSQHLKLSLKFLSYAKGAIQHLYIFYQIIVTSTSDISNEIISLLKSNGCHETKSNPKEESDKDK